MANTKITNHIVDSTVITGQTAVTVADGDYILVADASDSNALKKVLASDLIQSSEEISDIVGAMVSSNTESGITVAYQDSDNTLDFTIGTLNQNTTGTAATVTGAAQTNITSLGTLTALTVDNININGSEIDNASGDLLLDSAGNITLDTDGGHVYLKDGGTQFGRIYTSGTPDNLFIESSIQDKDIIFKGNDGGSEITALTLDMSNAGEATFNADLVIPSSIRHAGDADTKLDFNQANTMRLITGDVTAWICNASSMIVNEDSVDFDFRVESNDHTHMLFVDGGTNRVGINNPSSATAPVFPFVVWDDDEVTILGHGNNATYIQRYQTHATAPATLVMDKARGTQASPTTVTPGDDIGRILFRGYTNNGYYETASIHSETNTSNLVNNGADIPSDIYFKTTQDGGGGPVERMRIDYKGTVGIGINAPTAAGLHLSMGNPNSVGDAHLLVSKTGNNDWTAKFGPGSDDYGLLVRQVGDYMLAVQHHGDGNYEFRVDSNGAIFATDTSVNSISDRRLKENIVDAKSQWDDIKALKWRNFNWNEASGRSRDNTLLGLIADEVESVSPKLIGIDAQPKEDKDAGVTDPEYKNVKYSIVWMKAMKALQEAMERIETLEAEVTALKG